MRRITALLLCFLMLMAAAGCAHKSGAVVKVEKELDALKSSESVGSEVDSLRATLSDEGKSNFDSFLKKLRDFNYEVTGDKASDKPDEDTVTVTVRIKTYDFGREYLATWTDYLKENNDALSGDDLDGFYETLFARLAALDKKECIKYVDITCIEPLENGEWIANIKNNKQLQDAIFGGMLSEMNALADADDGEVD